MFYSCLYKKVKSHFIISSPRSGTTWLSKVLNAHPSIFCNERRLFGDYTDLVVDINKEEPRLRCTLDKFVKESLLPQQFDSIKNYNSDSLLASYIKTLIKEEKKYSGKKVLIDKVTPYLGTSHRVINSIHKFFPNTKIIYLVRDGRDVLTSGVFHWFNKIKLGDELSVFQQSRKNTALEGKIFTERFFDEKEINEWANFWVEPLRTIAFAEKHFPILIIFFEDMLSNQKVVLEKLYTFIKVKYNDNIINKCIEAGNFNKMSGGKPQGQNNPLGHVRKGIVGDWKNYFTNEDAKLFNEIAGRELIQFGYEKNSNWINEL